MKHAWLWLALGSAMAGTALAWHHPLWPGVLLVAFWAWMALVAWQPKVWLFILPASLPFLNFSPWTGWLVFEEFDILLLGTLAGSYGRMAWAAGPHIASEMPVLARQLMVLWATMGVLALIRGLVDAGGLAFDWYGGYADAMNSVRVFKSTGFALCFMPLIQHELNTDATLASRRLAGGMVLGLTGVTLAVVWERAAFTGLFDFSTHYRTVGLFWEMHVGGAAIDAYLVMAVPFVVWRLAEARRPGVWAGAAAVALLTGYACLTTFSRGVYFAVALSLMLLSVLLWRQTSERRGKSASGFRELTHHVDPWRVKASWLLVLALLIEVIAVLGGGIFMRERLSRTDRDLDSRLAHWQQGIHLLASPTDWLLGKGLGRLPANYAAQALRGEFSGAAKVRDELTPDLQSNFFVTIQGPPTRNELGGLYALTQRVALTSWGSSRVSLDVRVLKETDVVLKLCERHLLYNGHCQTATAHVRPTGSEWQTLQLPLSGQPFRARHWYASRLGLFSLSVLNAGGVADVDNVRLQNAWQQTLLKNTDFSQGLAHWFPASQLYFLPWHIDNLFLENLIERGALGVLFFLSLLAYAVWHLVCGRARRYALSAYLAASLCAALMVGLASSLMDVPRLAFLFQFLAIFSIQQLTSRRS